ncbi:hypothetical protein AKJ41_02550 [candidate division MSBL1 archaeon SCGC-AAA259O05]|uniref:ABC transporter domain-containing protein n=1 Tax=candidate division MSBL1 archaeon SCGC-AAA259O05 TaxID=1698271 RepID=A0A133V3Y1_9EURY|nr:hypothetical protein AKJ41_02550 [candidate division MSBL1 archaeon SCGC-AAA259O05]
MIELKDVHKRYEAMKVLDGVNLEVRRGEFVSIRGKSGIGKTTLVRIAGLLERPDSGRVLFEGRPVTMLNEGERSNIRLGRIGFIFQLHNLIPNLSVRENVELPLSLEGIRKEERSRKTEELLSYFDLEGFGERNPGSLSGGERQRVTIARALINDPDVVMADEPTASLDEENAELVLEMLERIRDERDVAIVLTTTNMRDDLPTDTDYILKDGKLEG